jgi:excisionase family DNA binding protein
VSRAALVYGVERPGATRRCRVEKDQELQPEWVSYNQSKKITGLSRGTIHKIIASGMVKAAKVGARTLIHRQSLLEYLDSQAYGGKLRNKAATLGAEGTEEGGS